MAAASEMKNLAQDRNTWTTFPYSGCSHYDPYKGHFSHCLHTHKRVANFIKLLLCTLLVRLNVFMGSYCA